mmetsp:Transcript_30871/g.81954  ORF Transcript_30871/g.81954 Transcript_30871/m.81954 type:complete len:95 (+) Transcript_30871:148-432(+)|eukprot:CAMPEP_0119503324 /NCGR_PEP_ID=MMETSP1344-20130328/24531_1 /TAXON_ID=236787 /ORGANISM="Florenciella parvula, Strain CCMP2471" /LENGTH=94 /DNA_ID=CAMNT_0007539609 /DNA_START=1 /DNA_END=285 /DNA_ORIENTATION=+
MGAVGVGAPSAAPLAPPTAYCCPISMFVMEDPVLCVGDNTTYERREIEAWLSTHNTSPMTNEALDSAGCRLVSNRGLKDAIALWVTEHGYDMAM